MLCTGASASTFLSSRFCDVSNDDIQVVIHRSALTARGLSLIIELIPIRQLKFRRSSTTTRSSNEIDAAFGGTSKAANEHIPLRGFAAILLDTLDNRVPEHLITVIKMQPDTFGDTIKACAGSVKTLYSYFIVAICAGFALGYGVREIISRFRRRKRRRRPLVPGVLTEDDRELMDYLHGADDGQRGENINHPQQSKKTSPLKSE